MVVSTRGQTRRLVSPKVATKRKLSCISRPLKEQVCASAKTSQQVCAAMCASPMTFAELLQSVQKSQMSKISSEDMHRILGEWANDGPAGKLCVEIFLSLDPSQCKRVDEFLNYLCIHPNIIDRRIIEYLVGRIGGSIGVQFFITAICSPTVPHHLKQEIIESIFPPSMDNTIQDNVLENISQFPIPVLANICIKLIIRCNCTDHFIFKLFQALSTTLLVPFTECFCKLFFFNYQTCSPAFHLVQIFTYNAIRTNNLSLLSVIAENLAQLPPTSPDQILPARLYPVSSTTRRTIKTCASPECLGKCAKFRTIGGENLYCCQVCRNYFSALCPTCSSCPIPEMCWGCAYRGLAAASVANFDELVSEKLSKSVDSYLVGLFVLFANIFPNIDQIEFILNSFRQAPPNWLKDPHDLLGKFQNSLSRGGAGKKGTDTEFVPSESFSNELAISLIVNDRGYRILSGILKYVISNPNLLLSVAGIDILKNAGLNALARALDEITCIQFAQSLLSQIVAVSKPEARILNAVFSFLNIILYTYKNTIPDIFFQELTWYISERSSLLKFSTKQAIFQTVLVDPKNAPLLFQYLANDEFNDYNTLLNSLMDEICVGNIPIDIVVSIVLENCSVSWTRLGEEASLIFRIFNHSNVLLVEKLKCLDSLLSSCNKKTQYGWLVAGLVEYLVGCADALCVHYSLRILTHVKGVSASLYPVLAEYISAGNSLISRSAILYMGAVFPLSVLPKISFSSDPRSLWLVGTILEISSSVYTTEEVHSFVDQLPKFAGQESIVLSVLGFICKNAIYRETVISKPAIIDCFKSGLLSSSALRALESVEAILRAALAEERTINLGPTVGGRPDGGVFCRPLAQLLDQLLRLLPNSVVCLDFMETIGIINPRTLTKYLFSSYILHDSANSRRLFERIFPKNRNLSLSYMCTQITEFDLQITFRIANYLYYSGYFKSEETRKAQRFFATLPAEKCTMALLLIVGPPDEEATTIVKQSDIYEFVFANSVPVEPANLMDRLENLRTVWLQGPKKASKKRPRKKIPNEYTSGEDSPDN